VIERTQYEARPAEAGFNPAEAVVWWHSRSEILVDGHRVYEELLTDDGARTLGFYVDDGQRTRVYWATSRKGVIRAVPAGETSRVQRVLDPGLAMAGTRFVSQSRSSLWQRLLSEPLVVQEVRATERGVMVTASSPEGGAGQQWAVELGNDPANAILQLEEHDARGRLLTRVQRDGFVRLSHAGGELYVPAETIVDAYSYSDGRPATVQRSVVRLSQPRLVAVTASDFHFSFPSDWRYVYDSITDTSVKAGSGTAAAEALNSLLSDPAGDAGSTETGAPTAPAGGSPGRNRARGTVRQHADWLAVTAIVTAAVVAVTWGAYRRRRHGAAPASAHSTTDSTRDKQAPA